MADKELIAATLAASVLAPMNFAATADQQNATARGPIHAVNLYEAILAELKKREALGQPAS